MTTQTEPTQEPQIDDLVHVPGAPALDGLKFRRFRGDSDFPGMVAAIQRAWEADRIEKVNTVENLRETYANLRNCDVTKDVLIIEGNGEIAGYTRVEWWNELEGPYIYSHIYVLSPEWRGKGVEKALLRYNETRLREIAVEAGHAPDAPRLFDAWAWDSQTDVVQLLLDEGYNAVRYTYEMIRPDLENIPDLPLPDALEIRPVTPDHYRAIWEAEVEAFKDHWGADEVEEGDFERWLKAWPMYFQPHIWKVAWDGDQVAGMVRNFILDKENARYGRKRGYTENISVRRPWRKRGLARALIAESLKMHKALGMEEAALGVDTENPSGALRLYESMGFKVDKREATYRKSW